MEFGQTEGIGTLRSHQHGPEFEDDGGISSDEGDNSEDEDEEPNLPPLSQIYIPPLTSSPQVIEQIAQPEPLRPQVHSTLTPTTPTANLTPRTPVTAKPGSPGLNISRILRRPTPSRASSVDNATSSSGSVLAPPLQQRSTSSGTSTAAGKKNKFRRSWSNQKKADYNFSTKNDIQGIVMLEIHGATDLPRLKNSASILFVLIGFTFP